MVTTSFLFFLLLFVLIGVSSSFVSKKNNSDYLLAGHDISPWLAALSAVATNNSGYMFIGMIGYTYTSGLQSIWLMVGWILGDLLTSFYVHKRLRVVTQTNNILSFGGVLSRWHGTDYRRLRLLVGILTVIFLGVYAGAQFKAGSKALHVLFGWDYSTGAIIGSVIVFAYCLSGGLRASIWTDAAQSIVMIMAMFVLFYMGIDFAGGPSSFVDKLDSISPTYLSLTPTGIAMDNPVGIFLFILGWFFGGIGVIGQPHIMIRFMTIKNPESMNRTRVYYYSWFIAFYALTICVGLIARIVLPDAANFDAELALPMMSQKMLPEILIGLVLAGIFSATMSTADSQILSCSASFSRDILPKEQDSLLVTKLTTAGVTILALCIALFGSKNVFELVLMSWSILSSAFGPLLFIYALNKKVSENVAILMVVNGVLVTYLWREFGLASSIIYEVAPGMLAGLLSYFFFSRTKYNDTKAQASDS